MLIGDARAGQHDDAQSAVDVGPRSRDRYGAIGLAPVVFLMAVVVGHDSRTARDLVIFNPDRHAALDINGHIRYRYDAVVINHRLAPIEVTFKVCFNRPPLSSNVPVVSSHPACVSCDMFDEHHLKSPPAEAARMSQPTPFGIGIVNLGLSRALHRSGITSPMILFFQENDANFFPVRWAMKSTYG